MTRLRAEAGVVGADVVVDVTAKAPAAFAQGVALARAGGTVVVAGTRGGGGTPGFDPDHVVYKELRVQGALGVDTADYRAALDLLARGTYPFADLPRRTVGLDDAARSSRRWPASVACRRSTPCSYPRGWTLPAESAPP